MNKETKLLALIKSRIKEDKSYDICLNSLEMKRLGIDEDIQNLLLGRLMMNKIIKLYHDKIPELIKWDDGRESIEWIPKNQFSSGVDRGNLFYYGLEINKTEFNDYYKKVLKENTKVQELCGSPKFIENPPKIVWGDIEIPLGLDAYLQIYCCKVAFRKKLGEEISWEEVAEEKGESYEGGFRTKPRSIYDAFRSINKKVEEKTKRKIFKPGLIKSYRIA